MRLSEIKGEDALDVVADLIEPIAEIAMDEQFMTAYRAGKPKLLLIKYVLKAHKHAMLTMLATLERKSVEDYVKEVNLLSLPAQILDIVEDPEVARLFGLQGQTEKPSFGSAMENTEASEE